MKPILVSIFLIPSVLLAVENQNQDSIQRRVESQVSTSEGSYSTSLNYLHQDEQSNWSTSVGVTATRSRVQETGVEDEVTREINWINSWNFESKFFLDLALGGSNTKINKIRTVHGDFTLGRVHESLANFSWALTLGSNNILQADPASGVGQGLRLIQRKSGIRLGFEPFLGFRVAIFGDRYSYNKNVDQVLGLLQSEAAIYRYGTAFADRLSTLIEQESGLNVSFDLNDKWSANLTLSQTQDAPQPKVKGASRHLSLNHRFNSNWDGQLLLGSTEFESTATTPSTRYSYLGLGAGYAW